MEKIKWMDQLKIGDKIIEVVNGEKDVKKVTGVSKKSIWIRHHQYNKFTSYDSNYPKHSPTNSFNIKYINYVEEFKEETIKEIENKKKELSDKIKCFNLHHLPLKELENIVNIMERYKAVQEITKKRC